MSQDNETAPEAQVYISSAEIHLDDFNKPDIALSYYHKAMELGFSEEVCLVGIARCHMSLADPDKSYEYYTRYIEAGYFSIGMSVNYAFLLVQRGMHENALHCLKKAYNASVNDAVRADLQKYIDHTGNLLRDAKEKAALDQQFTEYIARSLPVLRKLTKADLLAFGDQQASGCAVIVECRQHPWLEHSLRNVAHYLPEGWTMLVVHGNENRDFVLQTIEAAQMTGQIGTHNLDIDNLDRTGYSNLLKRPDFWGLIPTTRTLIFQTDSMLLRDGLEEFYEWDYIGAPWNDFHVPQGVGNGGLSLRTVAVMNEIARRFGKASENEEMEDVFFARMLHLHGQELETTGGLANRQAAHVFCAEWTLRDMPVCESPLGLHQAWRAHSPEQLEKWFAQADAGYRDR